MKKILSVILSLMLVFAGMAPATFAAGDYTLSDIVVNGGTLVGFDSADTTYDIVVPYVYKENDFKTFNMPEVSATASASSATVEIVKPAAVADGEAISIYVKDADGTVQNTYTLTIKTAGGSIFADGGFENLGAIYNNGGYGITPLREVVSSTNGAGSKLLKAHAHSNGYCAALNDTVGLPSISKDKTYINGFMVMLDPTSTQDPVNKSFLPGIIENLRANWGSDNYFSGAYYTMDGTLKADAKTGFDISDEMTGYMSVVSSDADVRIAAAMGSATTTDTYFYYDEMYLGELVVADMAVTDAEGNTSGTVVAGETITLTEKHTNQYGNSVGLTGTTTWAVLNNTDVTVDNNGNVTVADNAAAGTAIIEATFDTNYTGAAQDVVKQRYALTVIPQDGFVTNGSTHTASYTNNTGKDMTLRFISALYEGDVLQTVVITDNITVKVGETYSGSNTLAAGSGQTVRNFLWDKTTLVPVITE